MKYILAFFVCSLVLVLTGCKEEDDSSTDTQLSLSSNNSWFNDGRSTIEQKNNSFRRIKTEPASAKNIILFVGDGMGISTITAARILEGQRQGMMGEENQLSFGKFPFSGLSKTYNVDAQTPDSAGTMSAMVTGVKTDAGTISLNESVQRSNCKTVAGNEMMTALEMAEIAGLSTGIVTTARLTHATPAATYAHSPERNWEDISDMTEQAIDVGCKDIAAQFVDFEQTLEARYGVDIDGIEVAMGGGRRHFLPKDASFNSVDTTSDIEGDRTDGRNLVGEWQTNYPSGTYVMDQAGFDQVDVSKTSHLLALFNESHMRYEADRANDKAGEPSLSEMTAKAIDMLDNNNKGYFLMVESGRIDHGHHAGNAFNALGDTIELSNAVQTAVAMTNQEDTLIIVTADHSHVFTIAGYPKRGNPILGKVVSIGKDQPEQAADGLPYTTLGYTNGRGFSYLEDETDADAGYKQAINAGRQDISQVNTESPGYHQEALIPRDSETHGGEDVGIFAIGPGAHLVTGTNEQNVIFHIMDYAGALSYKAEKAMKRAGRE